MGATTCSVTSAVVGAVVGAVLSVWMIFWKEATGHDDDNDVGLLDLFDYDFVRIIFCEKRMNESNEKI